MAKRTYTPRKRAEQQDETRRRIVDAAMALHEELGPSKATISSIAARAGVQRLTVYRHFSDDIALFHACTSQWLDLHPPPDPAAWIGIAAPLERARTALAALYTYYRGTERMWEVSYRDLDHTPALREPMAGVETYLATVRDGLALAWTPEPAAHRKLRAAIGLAVRFQTWQGLRGDGLGDDVMADMMVRWLRALTEGA